MDYNNRMDQVIFTIFDHPVNGAEFNGWLFLTVWIFIFLSWWLDWIE